jgi:hypothetical protein
MSRRDLLNACGELGIRTDHVANGKRGSKDNNWLRTDLIEATYGPGMNWRFGSAAEADQVCARAVDCRLGRLGHLLGLAQYYIREGNDALVEYKRLCGLTRRRRDDEAEVLRVAREMFGKARTTQEEWASRASVQR